jgi:hypothetical protein
MMLVLDSPIIDGPSNAKLKARLMGAAIGGANGVGVRKDVLVVVLVAPLQWRLPS